jgi:hypothetical protein
MGSPDKEKRRNTEVNDLPQVGSIRSNKRSENLSISSRTLAKKGVAESWLFD